MVAFEVYLRILSNRRDHPATARAGCGVVTGAGAVSAEISLDQIQFGYQKLADPEVSRVVITRF
jgi:hypothetical protein